MNENLEILNILGVTTARQIGAAWISEDNETYDVPLGSCVARWSVRRKQRIFLKQLHTDSLTNVLYHKGSVLTTTYGGQIGLWDTNYNKKWIDTIELGVAVMYTQWNQNGNMASFTSFNLNRERKKIQDSREGTVTIWAIDNLAPKLLCRIDSCFEAWSAWTHDDKLIVFHHQRTYEESENKEYKQTIQVHAMRLSIHGNKEITLSIKGKELLCLTSSKCGTRFFISQADCSVTMFNNNLEVLWQYTLNNNRVFSATILRDFVTDQKNTIFSDGILIGTRNGVNLIHPKKDSDHEFSIHMENISNTEEVYIIKLHETQNQRFLWFFCPFSVFWTILPDDQLRNSTSSKLLLELDSITGPHALTCCGLAMDEKGEHIASGDFSGNVSIWKYKESGIFSHVPLRLHKADSMIRSMTWRHNKADNEVYFGCTDGTVWKWNIEENQPTNIFNMSDTVTCLLWMNGKDSIYLGASDTKGNVALYKEENSIFLKIFVIQAHGIIKPHQIEVWSVAWSPDNKYLATGSEDQTTHIYRVLPNQDPTLVAELTGPNAAVTCVDWKTTQEGDILALSSDDRTVHCWKKVVGETWNLFWKFVTPYSHLMITYCALEPGGYRLAVVTMLGHLYVWDLRSKQNILSQKLHTASVEGLQWHHKNNILASLSSDCTVQVFKIITQ